MLWNLLQTFNIIFDIHDITLCLLFETFEAFVLLATNLASKPEPAQ